VSPSIFDGKRIIVIGPAKTVVEELKNVKLTDFDVIVRMNRAIDVPLAGGNFRRVDVLFHNLKETGDRGAGKITSKKIRQCGTKIVMFPGGGAGKASLVAKARIKMLFRCVRVKIGMVPADIYGRIRHSLSGFSPTTGMVALTYFMESKFQSLDIVGFTFFQTKYMEGYNDDLARDEDGFAWAERRNIHNPKLEANYFKVLLNMKAKEGLEINLGQYVISSLADIEKSGA